MIEAMHLFNKRPSSNAHTFLISELPWSVIAAWMGSYLTIFLADQHLTAHQIGLAMGLGALLQVMGLGASGYFSRRFGRKGSIMAGDFLGWVLVMGVWAISSNALLMGLALVMNQAMGCVGPAWNSLFSEGENPKRLPRYFFILQLFTVFGGLALPLMEAWIAHRGVVCTGHRVMFMLWPFVTLAWLFRLVFLKESDAGKEAMAQRKPFSVVFTHLRLGLSGVGAVLAGLRILAQVPLMLFANLAPLALVAVHGSDLPASRLALLPIAATVAALLLMILHQRYPDISSRAMVGVSLILLVAGFLLLALTGPGHFWRVMLAWALIVAGQSQFWTSHTSYWMTWLPDVARVEVQGWIGVITAGMVAILSPFVAPILYVHPRPLWGIAVIVMGLACVLWLFLPPLAHQDHIA